MKLTVETAMNQGLLPVAVFDANGQPIIGSIVEIDTATGIVHKQKLSAEGRPLYDQGRVVFEDVQYPAPLTWKSLRQFSH